MRQFANRAAALRLEYEGDDFVLKEDPLQGKVEWKIRTHG